MKVPLLVLSLLGVLLSSAGWVIERAFKLLWLRRWLAPEADVALRALERLRAEPNLGLTSDDPAVAVLSRFWPRFSHALPVHAIGRTVAYVEFGPEVKNQIGLTLFDENLTRIEGYDWSIAEASEAVVASLETRYRRIGTAVFFAGVAITLTAAFVRFLT